MVKVLIIALSFSTQLSAILTINENIKSDKNCINKGIYLFDWKYKSGDDNSWSGKNYNDIDWKKINSNSLLLDATQIHWLRRKISVCDSNEFCSSLYLHIVRLRYAYQIYFDGKLVDENGIFDSTGNIIEYGRLMNLTSINGVPQAPSEHLIAVRFSYPAVDSERLRFMAWIGLTEIRPFYKVEYFVFQSSYIAVSILGVIFGLALFWAGGSFKPYLLLSLICLPVLSVKIYEFLMYYLNISSEYFLTINITNYFNFLSQLFIISFFLVIFKIPNKFLHITIIAIILLAHDFDYWLYNSINIWIVSLYWLCIIVYALHKRMAGSIIALISFAIFIFPDFFELSSEHLGQIFYHFSYWLFIAGLFVVATRQISDQNKLRQSIEAKSKRLENELLKKTIQPHFITNSLSVVRSLSVSNPDKADNLIQAISNEFCILNKIINESEVSILEEIELCRYHLEVMGYRRDANYELKTDNILGDLKIPPLIFHTLIENGVTHSLRPKEDGVFRIKYSCDLNYCEFLVQNNGSKIKELVDNSYTQFEDGLGYKYVKSRLEERYPGKWKLEYGAENGLWKTKIIISQK